MASLRDAALRRRLDVLTAKARRAVEDRQGLRERAEIWAVLDPALRVARIDRKAISGLWPLSGAPAALRRHGDTPALQRADAAFIAQDAALSARRPYMADLPERARNFIGKPPPDPLHASVSDWCAWAFATRCLQEEARQSGMAFPLASGLENAFRRAMLTGGSHKPAAPTDLATGERRRTEGGSR